MNTTSAHSLTAADEVGYTLLTHPGTWIDLPDASRSALHRLVGGEWAHCEERRFIYCQTDDQRPASRFGYRCVKKVYVPADFDESSDDLLCDSCERLIMPYTAKSCLIFVDSWIYQV